MKSVYEVVRRPVITEKTTSMKAKKNIVAFEVAQEANRKEIKAAVEELFKVKVLRVNTLIVPSRPKNMGRMAGRKPAWKKAIVTLGEGDKIDFFEGV